MTSSAAAHAAEPDYSTDEQRWHAVQERDRSAGDRFVFAVQTTGIYCRPGCPSRHPLRTNVSFFATAADAERAGFRACKRCHPKGQSIGQRHAGLITRACRTIETADTAPTLAELAEEARLSPFHFHRIFRQITGLTPKAYADAHRADRVRRRLATSPSVTYAIYDSGYKSSGRFYASSAATIGMKPASYRAKGVDMRIRFAVGESSFGSVLVAATDRGICSILFGDDPQTLVEHLQDQFAHAELIAGDADFEATVATVIGFIEAPQTGLDLPLDVRGSAFQHRVWQALRTIPIGTTVTYADIARKIGAPGAARSVAGACACATNLLAVAIPCHRVVRRDGGLAGYRWGIDRKQALLTREATLRPAS